MGNTDSVFETLVLGEEVEEEVLEWDNRQSSATMSVLLWGGEAPVDDGSDMASATSHDHAAEPLSLEHAALEARLGALPATWDDLETESHALTFEERCAAIFCLLAGARTLSGRRLALPQLLAMPRAAAATARDRRRASAAWTRAANATAAASARAPAARLSFSGFLAVMEALEEDAGSSEEDSDAGGALPRAPPHEAHDQQWANAAGSSGGGSGGSSGSGGSVSVGGGGLATHRAQRFASSHSDGEGGFVMIRGRSVVKPGAHGSISSRGSRGSSKSGGGVGRGGLESPQRAPSPPRGPRAASGCGGEPRPVEVAAAVAGRRGAAEPLSVFAALFFGEEPPTHEEEEEQAPSGGRGSAGAGSRAAARPRAAVPAAQATRVAAQNTTAAVEEERSEPRSVFSALIFGDWEAR